jgi:hypothetical protein
VAIRVGRTPEVEEAPDDRPTSGLVERAAWKLWKASSRRFFVVLAVLVPSIVMLASVYAAMVATSNAAAVAAARGRGERVATSITEFQEHLSQANDEVAATLVSGDEQSSSSRARYEAGLLASSLALTRAGLDATGQDAERVEMLAADLDRFATLVVTSRAYPVGTRFYRDARATARDDLVPRANRTRTSAQSQLSGSADEVAGPRTAVAIAGLALALVTLVLAATLVAGRTRIRLHPAFLVAGGLLVVELVVVSLGLWTERDELQTAAGAEFAAYVDAQEAATTIFDMRTAETDAIAGIGDVADRYADFESSAAALGADSSATSQAATDPETLPGAVTDYADSVEEVRALAASNDDAAAEATVEGRSAIAYRSVRGLTVSLMNRSTDDLTARLDAAADAGVAWPVPLLLGGAAAVLAAGGVLRRGQAYVWWSA